MAGDDVKHVVITGGAGFLGRYTVRDLKSRHPFWTITILDIIAPESELLSLGGVTFLPVDVTSEASVNQAFARITSLLKGSPPDVVIHSAGVVPARALRYSTSQAQWNKVHAVNYTGTTYILAATIRSGCKRLVYTSSCTAIIDDLDHDYYYMTEKVPLGRATLHYGKSKALAEQLVLDPRWREESGLLACALRPCTIIGRGDIAVIGVMHDLIAKGETGFIVGDGANIYDFMCVENAARAHCLAVENLLRDSASAAGHAFFLSNDEPVYFWDFLAAIWAEFGHYPSGRIMIPAVIAWLVALLLEWITWLTGAASTLDSGSVKDGVRTQYADIRKARDILGYEPSVKLKDGVKAGCDVSQPLLFGRSLIYVPCRYLTCPPTDECGSTTRNICCSSAR
jgi:sterol-4alpha-carboxylate 3-dehydrogenase (decarboxylating)